MKAKRATLEAALMTLQTEGEMRRFLTDLCTPNELRAFEERWAIAQELHDGETSYRDIAQMLKASTATVTRVARFLLQERHQGYRLVLDRIS